ncbi:MAG: prepilin peptidase [Fimbriimonadales bacterium]|nr:prepilin peptidase [Fimbriimonadales bacterium]MDW8051055.1 prepilin peptidase [Armatimonadota bacterium]
MLPSWSLVFGIVFGAAVGSFLNMLVYRLPRNLSIVFPPSHCPACGHRLGVLDLVPLLSYLFLRGRCRYCRAPIPIRYFLVEAWNTALWAWLWHQWLIAGDLPLRFVIYAFASSVLIAIFFIDLEHYLIPDELNVALLILGLLHAGLLAGAATDWSWASLGVLSFRNAVLGALVGAGLLSLIAILGRVGLRKDAMGHGDIKLARGMGALLLAPGMLTAFALAIALGATIGGIWTLLRYRKAPANASTLELPEPEPEPIASLVLACALYMLWVDALLTLLPQRVQQRVYALLGQAEEVEEPFVETPHTLPFGPFLSLGTLMVLLFGEVFAGWVRAYLEWAGL